MLRLVVVLILAGVGYWYWSGPYQSSKPTKSEKRLQENALTMQRCIDQERRMQTAGGVAGVADAGSSGADAERLCAGKHRLRLQDGQWHDVEE
jgi:Tfp pilus assembly protein PilE